MILRYLKRYHAKKKKLRENEGGQSDNDNDVTRKKGMTSNGKNLPQISERDNEDYSSGPPKGKKRGKNTNEGEAGYSSLQKDSEPGNRQGDEAPSVNQFSPRNKDDIKPTNQPNAGD